MGYSRYGRQGKGLSDRAQHSFYKRGRSRLTSGVDRAMYDRFVMTFRSGGVDKFKGLYNAKNAARWAGGEFKDPGGLRGTLIPYNPKTAQREAKQTGNQFGAITTGRGRGYPSWVMNMLKGANTELGKPPQSGSSSLPIGLALVALKVLL